MLEAKAPNAQTMRRIVLEGHRFTPKEALELGLVDRVAGADTESLLAETQAMAARLGALAKTGAWGVNKVRAGALPCAGARARARVCMCVCMGLRARSTTYI